MIPTVYDICTKEIVKISVDKSLADAIEKMSSANIRTIVVEDTKNKVHHILTTTILLGYKLSKLDKKTSLSNLDIVEAKSLDKNLNLLSVLNYIDSTNEYMVILDRDNLVGIVSYTDIINNIDPQLLMKRQNVASLIHQFRAITTNKNASTFQVIELMKHNNSDSVIVVDDDNKPKGIFTTKDFIDIIHHDYDLSKPIKNHMNTPVDTLENSTTIEDAISFIKEKHYKRIVVVDENNEISGVITQKELLKVVYNKWIELIKEEGSKMSKTNKQLVQATSELQKKISLDYLTKLYTRNKFEDLLDEQIQKFVNYQGNTFSLLIIDIDNFKIINDSYGHLIGDKVLKEVAKILTLVARNSDIIARWGGEEFVIILPNTNIEQAAIAAEKLRSSIEKHIFKDIKNLTCSFGVAQFHNSDSKIDLFKRADEALYKAKSSGRNKVELEHI